ncbi:hypothetical protein FN846DRAFT_729173 [Sphaerosporella brunnea]|uniref:Uncharacterized protein n=1 Tax=Sphaerosporella brunnea TaxID=1250544 RepID=A0A5J5EY00_9PEZI|nr:hypothetical protein FN846DRAFT_729173 [Sphaerosporella brunnea]
MAATTDPEIGPVFPGLAEVRGYSQSEVMAFLEREGVLEGFMPAILDKALNVGITGRHLVEHCHDPAFLTPHVGPCLSHDIAKLVKKLYETAGMSCFLSSPKFVSNCNIAHPLPNATIERLPQEQRRRAVCTYFPHDFLIEGLLMGSKNDGPMPTSGASRPSRRVLPGSDYWGSASSLRTSPPSAADGTPASTDWPGVASIPWSSVPGFTTSIDLCSRPSSGISRRRRRRWWNKDAEI